MGTNLHRVVEECGDGHVMVLDSGESVFRLNSYRKNPVVRPEELGLFWHEEGGLCIGSVFNPGAVLYQDKVVLTPRCHMNYRRVKFFDQRLGLTRYAFENYISEVWVLMSEDGIRFRKVSEATIKGDGSEHMDFLFGIEDVRVIQYKQRYFLVGCGKIKPPFQGNDADRVAIYSTKDFKEISYHGMIRDFDSRNAVPFFMDDEAYILLRFHPHTYLFSLEAGTDQLFNPAEYSEAWKKMYNERSKNLLLEAGRYPHEREKTGPGPPPVKTDDGWLLIYHAVGELEHNLCNEYGLAKSVRRGYSVCAAVLDLEDPRRVLCRTQKPLYIPSKPYELEGGEDYPVDVPAVVFPTGTILKNDKLLIYCGAGDKYVILLTCNLRALINYMFDHCRLQ